jgi:pyruvate dehydrogenase E2 component (dihydrolipoamide acetyltransferase)
MNSVLMPKLGDTMEEGKLLSWHKQVGDPVAKGESLAEIETDKVNIEVEAFAAGVLRKLLVEPGQTVPVGTPIALVGEADEPLPDAPAAQKVAAPAAATEARPEPAGEAQDAPGETLREVTLAPVGAMPAVPNGASAPASRIFISPIARRLAAEHQLDITQIPGSGPGGRIIRSDVEAVVARMRAAPETAAAASDAAAATSTEQDVEIVPLSQMRKTIARRLQQSMRTIPHFYMTISIDITRLSELRASINEYAAAQPEPVKVTLNDLVIRAVALALRRVPEVNASFDAPGERILRHKRVHIGNAVALDRGLIAPVIRDADKRGPLAIARESRRLIEAARANTLKPEEFQGGTFTVSNAGMYGVEEFTAVINPPEAGILAVGAAVPTPVVRDGQVVVRETMKVTLSSDHRVLDGAVSARFLQVMKSLLEQPMSLLLD